MPNEIERNWAIGEVDPEVIFHEATSVAIKQAYLSLSEDGNTEVRIRVMAGEKDGQLHGTKYTMAVKRGSGMVREEVEIPLLELHFNELWEQNARHSSDNIAKVRFYINYGEYTLELDIYSGNIPGLKVAEVEFTSEEAANAFEPPAWFGKEVTDDPQYRDSWLAKNGYPDYREHEPRADG